MSLATFQNRLLGIIACLLFTIGLYKLVLLILLLKIAYQVEDEAETPFLYNQIDKDIEFDDCYVHEHDVDSSYWSNLLNEEIYLINRCRFMFDFYGGNSTLTIEDYHSLLNLFSNIYSRFYFYNKKMIEKEKFFSLNKKNFFIFLIEKKKKKIIK